MKALAGAFTTLFLLLPVPGTFADADALARIVDGKCVPDEQANGKPAPCAAVDLSGHFAILKDLVGASQFLLIATTPEAGIEAPDLEAADAPNYFEDAWASRHFMADKLGVDVPRDDVGLAINSVQGRTQNRLHIHIDCMRTDVLQQLHAADASIGANWAPLPGGLLGHPYRAMRLAQPELTGVDPFALVAANLPESDKQMGDETIVAVAAPMPGNTEGFYLLADNVGATPGDHASGEELQDHDCAVLHH